MGRLGRPLNQFHLLGMELQSQMMVVRCMELLMQLSKVFINRLPPRLRNRVDNHPRSLASLRLNLLDSPRLSPADNRLDSPRGNPPRIRLLNLRLTLVIHHKARLCSLPLIRLLNLYCIRRRVLRGNPL